jgi:tetratricopeptide (TPR) repeat protein/GTP-binding protein EngB required for normal cell division
MGILDRIAGTLEELTGDAQASLAAEVERARALAGQGNGAAAEILLAEIARRAPRAALPLLALGQLLARRGALEEAVGALGRAVDVEGGDAEAWVELGEVLSRLGRTEPATDALRRGLTLAADSTLPTLPALSTSPTSPVLRRRAHAALGAVHATSGRWQPAARELRRALDLAAGDDGRLALDYGRVLAHLGERDASEWLTRAARAEGADSAVFAEAAAATCGDGRAEALLREGLVRVPGEVSLRAALVRFLARAGRSAEAIALGESARADAPEDPRVWAALREACAAAGRWREALAAAAVETRLGAAPALPTRVSLALGAEDPAALATLARLPAADVSGALPDHSAAAPSPPLPGDETSDAALRSALEAFGEGRADEAALLLLGRLAPGEPGRRFVARAGAPVPPPAGQLAGLLGWAQDFAATHPALFGLAIPAARAAEALDRPLLMAVMGEFNAGKSSIVNALCGEEVAPTGVTPTTATINILRYAALPQARAVYHDGTTRAIPPDAVAAFLTALRDDDARDIRLVEIFLPVETLRRVEIVDTPGLNSIRPEHERVARDFLRDADAIVWVLAAGQAAKATEKEALGLAHAAGKRVVGVLNKIDLADASEVEAVVRHVGSALEGLLDSVVAFSATRALEARRAGRSDPGWEKLSAVLDQRFFAAALDLKRATALSALDRFVEAARAASASADPATPAPTLEDLRAALERLAEGLASVLDAERIALRARLEEGYRKAAIEVREFVQPRSWLFGEHRATRADEEFLTDLLEDAVDRAVERTRAALLGALQAPDDPDYPSSLGSARDAATQAVSTAIDRFGAYARGVIEGGAVPDFFRHQLPRLRLEIAAIRDVLVRRAPDPEELLFAGLRRDLDAVFDDARAVLAATAADTTMRALLNDERLTRPLEAFARAVEALKVS